MALRDADRKDSSDDPESLIEGHDVGRDGEESAQFLPADLPPSAAPPKVTQRYVILMCVQFLFMVEFSQFIMEPPLQQIMEGFVCVGHFPDHVMGTPVDEDNRCKDPDVQRTLAMARSWLMWVGMLVSLVVQMPYGIMADKYGRRPVLFLGLLGVVLATSWYMIVLLHPESFTIWYLLLGTIPTIIGGGAPVIVAMVWTILMDCTPVEERTSLFYQLHAMMLILSAVFRPLAGWLLSIDPWLPMWLGLGSLILSMFSTLLIPETLHFNKLSDDKRHEAEASGQPRDHLPSYARETVLEAAWATAKKDLHHIWQFILTSKSLMLLVFAYALCYPIMIAFEMNMLQYVTKRFQWDWSTATYFTTISKVTSVIVLLVFLPLCSRLLTNRYRLDTLTRDLYLSRGSVIFIAAGNLLTAAAAAPWLLVVSLIVLSLGNGFQPQLRALLAGIVDENTMATLNTTIATVETLMGLVSVPALGWLLSKGIELGGAWMGLPFLMTFFCATLAAVAMFVFKMPPSVKLDEGTYELVEQDGRAEAEV